MTRGGSWFPGTQKRYNVANIITNVILHSQQQQTFNCGGKKNTYEIYTIQEAVYNSDYQRVSHGLCTRCTTIPRLQLQSHYSVPYYCGMNYIKLFLQDSDPYRSKMVVHIHVWVCGSEISVKSIIMHKKKYCFDEKCIILIYILNLTLDSVHN